MVIKLADFIKDDSVPGMGGQDIGIKMEILENDGDYFSDELDPEPGLIAIVGGKNDKTGEPYVEYQITIWTDHESGEREIINFDDPITALAFAKLYKEGTNLRCIRWVDEEPEYMTKMGKLLKRALNVAEQSMGGVEKCSAVAVARELREELKLIKERKEMT